MTIDNTETVHDAEIIDVEIEPTNEIATTQSTFTPAKIVGGIPHFDQYLMLAERICRTAMVPTTLRGQADQVLAVVMYGAELGIGPMQALQQINFIEGKPSMAPELMRALIRQAGHKLNITQSKTECVIVGERGDTGEVGESEFTIDDAVDAGLCSIDAAGKVRARSREGKILPWEKYTRDMLLARATSRIARMMFSDVIAGMSYTPEEVESFSRSDDDETPTVSKPARRQRSSSSAQHTTRRAAPARNEPAASEEQINLIRDALAAMNDAEKETLNQHWLAEQLPPPSQLSVSQAKRAWEIVSAVLDSETPPAPAQSGTLDERSDVSQSDSEGAESTVERGASKVTAPKLTKPMYGLIRGLCRELYGYEETEDCDLKCSAILGHGVTLATMTKAEGHKCIDQMQDEKEQLAKRSAAVTADDAEEPL